MAILVVAVPLGVQGQAVSGVVVSAAGGQPVPYSTVIVGDSASGRFANAAGKFVLRGPSAGNYRVRARQIGFMPLDTTVSASSGSLTLVLQPVASGLAATPAEHLHGCDTPGLSETAARPAVATIFELLRENVERHRILLDQYPLSYRAEDSRAVRQNRGDAVHDSVIAADTATYDSRQRHQYSVGSVVYEEHTPTGERRMVMYLPTLSDLADPAFQAAHCFAYAGDANHELRIDFRPADRIKAPDVAGTVYLDDTKYIVRRALFRLTHSGAAGGGATSITVTTTFREEVPLVPMFVESRTEQPLSSTYALGASSSPLTPLGYKAAGNYTGFTANAEQRISVQLSRVLDLRFIGDTIGGAPGEGRPPEQPATVTSVDLSCTMPPSFETADALIYGTLGGSGASDVRAGDVLTKLRPLFHMPDDFELPVYGLAVGSKVTQTLAAQVAFTVDHNGNASHVTITATSLSPTVDSNLVGAVRRADLRPLKAGRYTLSLSAVAPPPAAPAILFSRLNVSVIPIVRAATLDPDSTQPRLSVNGTFEFVVDEHGRAMPSTLLTAASSPDALATAAKALPAFRFRPALAGSCPIKQEVTLTGLAQ